MKSIFQFIVKPIGNRYNNEINIEDKALIINAGIEDHKFVNRLAEVVEIPAAIKTPIKKGDKVIVHFNLFRRWYDIKGNEKNSNKYFKDDMYFASSEQIYMYQKQNKWSTNYDYCFVKPILETSNLKGDKLKSLRGILKYGNSSLEAMGVNPGDYVGFKPGSEFEFVVNKELFYCMKSNDIVVKHERKGNETEYNPSWAESSRGIN